MLESFKKAIFRVLCLGVFGLLGGGGLMAEPTPKELFDLGVESYKAKNFTQAKKYFEKACGLNVSVGCGVLGFLYGSGKGVEKDLIKAAYFYSKACELKDGLGCGALAALYVKGHGVEQNIAKAAQYISKACKLGDQEACEALKEK